MNIRPLHDRVIVRRTEEKKVTASGLIIPDSATEKPAQGEVVAVGSGKKTDDGKVLAMDVSIGDTVLFDQYAGSEVKVDEEKLLIMREQDITAIIE